MHQQAVALLELLIEFHGDSRDHAGNRRADLSGLIGVGLGFGLLGHLQLTVADRDLAGLPVELEEDGACAVGMRLADGEELNHQRLAGFQLDRHIRAALHAVIELRCGQHVHVAPVLAGLGELEEHVGIHQVAEHFVVQRFAADLLLDRGGGFFQVDRGQVGAGASALRLRAFQDDLLQVLRPAACRVRRASP